MKPQSAPPGSPRWVRPSAAPFPPPGPPGRVPRPQRYYGAVRLPVPLTPASVAFARRYPAARLSFRSQRSRSPNRGPGVRHPVPLPGQSAGRQAGPPRFPGNPVVPSPCSSTPAGPATPGHNKVCRHGPRYVHNEGSHNNESFEAQSHGFGTRCLRFVEGVATPDAKLASGCWPSSAGRDWLPAGLQRKVSMHQALPPFRSFPDARTFILGVVPK